MAQTKEVSTTTENRPMFTDNELAGISSLSDAMDLFGGPVEDISNYGTGFEVAEKEILVGVPFLILASMFNESEYDTEHGVFVTLYAVTDKGDKWIINDGSTGICRQMVQIAERKGIPVEAHASGPAGLLVKRGLTRSDYDGAYGKATTFYLAI